MTCHTPAVIMSLIYHLTTLTSNGVEEIDISEGKCRVVYNDVSHSYASSREAPFVTGDTVLITIIVCI